LQDSRGRAEPVKSRDRDKGDRKRDRERERDRKRGREREKKRPGRRSRGSPRTPWRRRSRQPISVPSAP
jgi:hypothetical protein